MAFKDLFLIFISKRMQKSPWVGLQRKYTQVREVSLDLTRQLWGEQQDGAGPRPLRAAAWLGLHTWATEPHSLESTRAISSGPCSLRWRSGCGATPFMVASSLSSTLTTVRGQASGALSSTPGHTVIGAHVGWGREGVCSGQGRAAPSAQNPRHVPGSALTAVCSGRGGRCVCSGRGGLALGGPPA